MCVRCVFVFLVTALYCFSMDILSEINFMMMMMMMIKVKRTGMGILLRSLPIQFFIMLHRFKL